MRAEGAVWSGFVAKRSLGAAEINTPADDLPPRTRRRMREAHVGIANTITGRKCKPNLFYAMIP